MQAANNRIRAIAGHINPAPAACEMSPTAAFSTGPKSADDVVIVCAVRTAVAKGLRGGFKDTMPEELLSAVLKEILERTKIDPKIVDDIAVGNVLPAGGGATVARMAMLHAGFPNTSSVYTLNRQCSSGIQACASIAAAIHSGLIEIGIGAGVESMTHGYGMKAMPTDMSEKVSANPESADCLVPMGLTSENVASEFNVSRQKQDAFAASSHKKAAAAQASGKFDSEIVPVEVKVKDAEGNTKTVVISKDEGIRAGTTAESLAKLKPAFASEGTTTAGNSSQVSDGAAAVLLMKRSTAARLNLPVLGRFVGFAVAGVPPSVMGIGPAFAIPKVLKQVGLTINDIDVFEINEAFASQAVYSVEKLGINIDKVNPNGGAIALGHPLGCTGARLVATILPELKRRNARYGIISMCIGTGMGAAAVIENE
eukprot:TRINITY_DN471_c0_g1_i1.p2 TRINITY_DN471_c0_g1~~TRINITY_DN471_c0_g1_i1.p2  ORF type:complete len:436 (-),score=209.55 TRINITY_DN471_c0_g1_i1:69-1346(-)